MKKFSVAALTLFMLMIIPVLDLGAEWHELVEQMGSGSVNWTQGIMQAKGIGAPPEKYYGKPQAGPMVLSAARLDAMRNLLEVVQGIRISSSTLVRDFMTESDEIRSNVEGMVKSAQIVKQEYLSDGTVEITIQMSLNGGFAQLVLPSEIKQVEPIKPVLPQPPIPQPPVPPPVQPLPPVVTPTTPPPVQPSHQPTSEMFTGMVVDARGLSARPAMAPRILDENGREVYGSAFVSREFAVQQGVSGYARDLASAQRNPRVTNNPLTVKGLKTVGPGESSDIVIGASDASQLRSASENLSFLKRCRVMIVVD